MSRIKAPSLTQLSLALLALLHLLKRPDQRQQLVVKDIAEIVATAGYELLAEGIESEGLLQKSARSRVHPWPGVLFRPLVVEPP